MQAADIQGYLVLFQVMGEARQGNFCKLFKAKIQRQSRRNQMKQVKGWWFGSTTKKLPHGDGRKIVIGKTHEVKGEIIPCEHGLHLSKRMIDALQYAPGPVIYRVVGSGIIVPHGNPVDKYACSERTYVSGGVDISATLRLFARKCALDVIHLWNPPEIVVR